MKKRLQYLDICKGMGIFLVVLGHVLQNNPFRIWIYSFHMPLFFFLSGYTFFYNKVLNFKEFIENKFKSIIIPYFLFSFIWYLYWLSFERNMRPDTLNIQAFKPLLGIFYGVGNGSWLVFNIALWFLPCLFITEVVFYCIIRSIDKERNIFAILLTSSFIGFLISQVVSIRFVWGIDIAFTSIVFYGLGYFFHKNNLENKFSSKQTGIILVLIAINILSAFVNKLVDMNLLVLGNYFLYYISAISGTMFLFLFSKKIAHNKWLSYLGSNSLIIMAIHEPIKRIIIKLMSMIVNIPVDVLRQTLLSSFLCTIIIILILTPAIFIIKAYFPFLLGKGYFHNKGQLIIEKYMDQKI